MAVKTVFHCVIQLLAGAQINDMTPQKETALHIAAAHDRASIATALLGEHINFDAVDEALNNGNSILQLSNKNVAVIDTTVLYFICFPCFVIVASRNLKKIALFSLSHLISVRVIISFLILSLVIISYRCLPKF